MTLAEAHSTLKTRIGWKDDGTLDDIVLSPTTTQTDSGAVFNTAHAAITIQNIYSVQPKKNITSQEFNDYLVELRDECVRQVLSDAFERNYLDGDVLTTYPTGFDEAIRLKMVIIVAEMIMTSIRSNRIERFNRDFASKLNYDLYRESPNKFAIRNANYEHSLGIATKYGKQIRSVQRRFGDLRNVLKTITKGQVKNELYPRDKYRH